MRTRRFEQEEHTSPPGDLVNICGVLVHTRPEKADTVAQRLDGLDGVEVHMRGPNGKLVVVVEDTATARAIDHIESFNTIDGVVAASLVFHQFEDAEALQGEIPA